MDRLHQTMMLLVVVLAGTVVAQQVKIDDQRDRLAEAEQRVAAEHSKYVDAVNTAADLRRAAYSRAERVDTLERARRQAEHERDAALARLTDQRSRQRRVTDYLADRFDLGRGRADVLAGHLVDAAARARQRYGVALDATMLAAQISAESAFDAEARSTAGAVGLMQVMPFHVERYDFLHRGADLLNPRLNVRAGAFVLAEELQQHGGDPRAALRAYHGGDRAVDQPKQVTLAYVRTVMTRWQRLS